MHNKVFSPYSKATYKLQNAYLKHFAKMGVYQCWFVRCYSSDVGYDPKAETNQGPMYDFRIFTDEHEMNVWMHENIDHHTRFEVIHKVFQVLHGEWQEFEEEELDAQG